MSRKGVTFTTHFHTHPQSDYIPSEYDKESKIYRHSKGLTIPSVIYYSIGKNKSASSKY